MLRGDSCFEKTVWWAEFKINVTNLQRVHMYMKPYGHAMQKATILVGNANWLPQLKWGLPERRQQTSKGTVVETCGWKRNENGKVSGKTAGLKASAAYVPLFCANLVRLFLKHDLDGDHPDRVNARRLAWNEVCGLTSLWCFEDFLQASAQFFSACAAARHTPVMPSINDEAGECESDSASTSPSKRSRT